MQNKWKTNENMMWNKRQVSAFCVYDAIIYN